MVRRFDDGVIVANAKEIQIINKQSVKKSLSNFSTNLFFQCFSNKTIFGYRDSNDVTWYILYDLRSFTEINRYQLDSARFFQFENDIFSFSFSKNKLNKLSTTDLSTLWSIKLTELGVLPETYQLAHKQFHNLSYSDDKIFFAFDGAIGCIDANTGKKIWLHEFDNVRMFIQDIGDYIFVPLGGSFYYLDKNTGKQTDEQKWIPEYRVGTIEDGDKYETWSFSNKSLYHQGFIYNIITDRRGKQKLLKADGVSGEHLELLDLPKFGYENTFEIFEDHIYIHTSNNELLIIDPLKDFGPIREK